MMRRRFLSTATWAALLGAACSDTAGVNRTSETPDDGGTNSDMFASGTELRVEVPEAGRASVRLGSASTVAPGDATPTSLDWDLAFEGFDVFTNGGVSGSGKGASFGPLEASDFKGDVVPVVPFVSQDKAGGAFLDWYAYDGTSHALYSRFHVFGVQDEGRLWKVQVLGYYGERDGAAIAALYRLRYAELLPGGAGPVNVVTNIDGTAGGTAAPKDAASECIDLGSTARTMLTPEHAQRSNVWHLCFRRDSITVNGEIGGPRGVGAVDIGVPGFASETLAAVKTRTADGMMPAFDAVTAASFTGRAFRGDHVVSGFGDGWIDRTKSPWQPAVATWLVVDASGQSKFLVVFTSFEAPSSKSPGTVVMRVKRVKG